jgi:hypothetical protein
MMAENNRKGRYTEETTLLINGKDLETKPDPDP